MVAVGWIYTRMTIDAKKQELNIQSEQTQQGVVQTFLFDLLVQGLGVKRL